MTEKPKTAKMLVVGRKYLLLVTFVLGVFVSFSILYFMIPLANPKPWMESILMLCAGFFMSTVLLHSGQVIVNDQSSIESTTEEEKTT